MMGPCNAWNTEQSQYSSSASDDYAEGIVAFSLFSDALFESAPALHACSIGGAYWHRRRFQRLEFRDVDIID